MTISALTRQDEWDPFVLSLRPNSFLHSWNWKILQEQLGEQAVALGAVETGALVGVALGVTVSARRGRFLFCPHGPLTFGNGKWEFGAKETTAHLLAALEDEARKRGCAFLRVSPLLPENDEWRQLFAKRGYRPAPIHMHAETMWVLNIAPDEEALLRQMRKTTRNLIRRAERDGVRVRFSEDAQDLALFARLYEETAAREHFVPFSRAFLSAEFAAFHRDHRVLLVFAEYQGVPLAAALIPLYGSVGFYHQGASSRQHPKIPAAYLLHWEIIRELKRRGMATYNFWGVAPDDNAHHPWVGLTLFKKGFGGMQQDTLHAQDLPFTSSYWLTYIVESLRRRKRHL